MEKAAKDREAQLAAARDRTTRRKEALHQLAMAEKIMREDHDILRELSK